MKKRLVGIVLLAALAGGGAWYWRSRTQAGQVMAPQYAVARRGNLTVEVSATGSVEPEYTVEIKSKASGTINTVAVQAGDPVKKGALLLEIDPVVERRKLTQAQADLRIAEAQRGSVSSKLEHAISQLQRDEALQKRGLVPSETVDQERKEVAVMRGDIQVSEAQLIRARASYAEAKDRLAETRLYAPLAGTVLERLKNPGQVITAGTAQGGETLLTIADLSRLFIRVKVDEADVAKVAPGQSARITADALPGQVFNGTVLRVAPQGRVESSVTVFEVVVEITGEGRKLLRPMLTANVSLRVGEVKDALLVPRRAVQQQDGRSVLIVEGRGAQPVEVGLSDDQQIEIRKGIEEGTRVQLPGRPSSATKKAERPGGGVPGGMGGMRGMGGRLR